MHTAGAAAICLKKKKQSDYFSIFLFDFVTTSFSGYFFSRRTVCEVEYFGVREFLL